MGESVDVVREREALAALLADAISGRGWLEGPTREVEVIARRLVEGERVRVDMPSRLSIEQTADLALRCGRALTRIGVLETLVASLEAALTQQMAQTRAALVEAEQVRERVVVLARDLRLATEARELVEDRIHTTLARQAAVSGAERLAVVAS